jgi:Anthrone oxygenase
MLIGQLALMSVAAFAGAAFYVNFVEQPARLQLDDRALLAEWKPSYHRGALMQATLAMISGILGFAAWWLSDDWRWIVGAVLALVPWPYTLIGIKPTNDRLNAIPVEVADAASRRLVENGAACMRCARRSGLRRRSLICGR